MVNSWEGSEGIIEFPLDLTNFSKLVERIAHDCSGLDGAWFRIAENSGHVQQYLNYALKLYLFTNLKPYHDQMLVERAMSTERLESQAHNFKVPRYLRYVFREIARPMEYGNLTYIPRIRLANINMYEASGLEAYDLQKVYKSLGKLLEKEELVPLEYEQAAKVPLMFYDENTQDLYTPVLEQPKWRIEAMRILKHVRFNPSDTSDTRNRRGSSQQSTGVNEIRGDLTGIINGRHAKGGYVNGHPWFTISPVPLTEVPVILSEATFPPKSEDNYSLTGPRRKRTFKATMKSKKRKLVKDDEEVDSSSDV